MARIGKRRLWSGRGGMKRRPSALAWRPQAAVLNWTSLRGAADPQGNQKWGSPRLPQMQSRTKGDERLTAPVTHRISAVFATVAVFQDDGKGSILSFGTGKVVEQVSFGKTNTPERFDIAGSVAQIV